MKNKYFYCSAFLATALLAACNADVKSTDNQPVSKQEAVTANEEITEIVDTPSSTDEQSLQPTNVEIMLEETEEVRTQAEVEQIEQVDASSHLNLITSLGIENTYIIQHPEYYTLIAEEPGRDMLIYSENEALSMRIETFSKKETSFSTLTEETTTTLTAVAPLGNYTSYDLSTYIAKRNDLTQSVGYLVEYESDYLITVIFETSEQFTRLTIFDDYITALSPEFLEAGFTIK